MIRLLKASIPDNLLPQELTTPATRDWHDQINGEVTYYPYRTVQVRDVFLTLPRSACRELEEALAEKAGVRPDNHSAYKIEESSYEYDGNPVTTYLSFSDFSVRFGRTIVEEEW